MRITEIAAVGFPIAAIFPQDIAESVELQEQLNP